MQKIKYLLGIGILSALFSTCFSQSYVFNVEYYSNNNQYSNYTIGSNINGSTNKNFVLSANDGYFTGILFNRGQTLDFYQGTTNDITSSVFDLSNYSLSGSYDSSRRSLISLFIQDGTKISLLNVAERGYYSRGTYYFPITSGVSSPSSIFTTSSGGNFIRVLSDGLNCIGASPSTVIPINSGFCSSNRIFVFGDYTSYDSLVGVVHDSLYNGEDYIKGGISSSIGNMYSFYYGLPIDSFTRSGTVCTFSSGPVLSRTVWTSSDGTYRNNNGIFLMRLNSLTSQLDFSDFQVIAIATTGTIADGNVDFIYSIYSCPYSSTVINDCSFVEGGKMLPSGTSNSFNSYSGSLFSLNSYASTVGKFTNGTTKNLLYFLALPSNASCNNSVQVQYIGNRIYNSFEDSTNILTLYRPGSDFSSTYSAFLDNSYGFDIYTGAVGPTEQLYSGSVAIGSNCTWTRVCTDGTGSDGNIYSYCTDKCLGSGDLVSGSYVGSDGTIYYVDSSFDYSVSSNGLVYDTGFLDSDGILSVDFYSGLFNGDSSFKLGVCPYPASDLLSFATKIRIGNFYPFMPLNCFVSAFQQGAKVHFFDDYGLFPDLNSQLINGNTHFHITLYKFFDFLLSLGLLFLLSALHRLLVK